MDIAGDPERREKLLWKRESEKRNSMSFLKRAV